jgi:hypothetical protein
MSFETADVTAQLLNKVRYDGRRSFLSKPSRWLHFIRLLLFDRWDGAYGAYAEPCRPLMVQNIHVRKSDQVIL